MSHQENTQTIDTPVEVSEIREPDYGRALVLEKLRSSDTVPADFGSTVERMEFIYDICTPVREKISELIAEDRDYTQELVLLINELRVAISVLGAMSDHEYEHIAMATFGHMNTSSIRHFTGLIPHPELIESIGELLGYTEHVQRVPQFAHTCLLRLHLLAGLAESKSGQVAKCTNDPDCDYVYTDETMHALASQYKFGVPKGCYESISDLYRSKRFNADVPERLEFDFPLDRIAKIYEIETGKKLEFTLGPLSIVSMLYGGELCYDVYIKMWEHPPFAEMLDFEKVEQYYEADCWDSIMYVCTHPGVPKVFVICQCVEINIPNGMKTIPNMPGGDVTIGKNGKLTCNVLEMMRRHFALMYGLYLGDCESLSEPVRNGLFDRGVVFAIPKVADLHHSLILKIGHCGINIDSDLGFTHADEAEFVEF